MAMMAKKLYRPDEAAEILSVSRWTIYRWVRDEKLRSTKLGRGSLRIFRDSIEELIRNGADEQRL